MMKTLHSSLNRPPKKYVEPYMLRSTVRRGRLWVLPDLSMAFHLMSNSSMTWSAWASSG